MANFSSAFGFRVFLVPVTNTVVDVSSVSGGIGGSGFIDNTTVVADNAVITEGANDNQILVAGESVTNGSRNVADDADITADTVFELLGLTDASLSTDTSSEEVVTYGDDGGYSQSVATTKSWSISLAGVTDFNDAGYQAMRLIEKNNVSGALRVKIGRTTPAGEEVYGYATLQSFSESVEAGSIVSFTVECAGYGPLGLGLAA